MYIEEYLARFIKDAARLGCVRHLAESDIFTDMTGTGEWEGRAKLYVLREETSLLGDLSDAWGGGACAESTVTVAAVGADKIEALETITDAVRTLKSLVKITDDLGETVTIDEDETAVISGGETMATDTLNVLGTLDGEGRVIAERITGDGDVFTDTEKNPISGVLAASVSGVQRFENGAFRDQYYQTRKFKILHTIDL